MIKEILFKKDSFRIVIDNKFAVVFTGIPLEVSKMKYILKKMDISKMRDAGNIREIISEKGFKFSYVCAFIG